MVSIDNEVRLELKLWVTIDNPIVPQSPPVEAANVSKHSSLCWLIAALSNTTEISSIVEQLHTCGAHRILHNWNFYAQFQSSLGLQRIKVAVEKASLRATKGVSDCDNGQSQWPENLPNQQHENEFYLHKWYAGGGEHRLQQVKREAWWQTKFFNLWRDKCHNLISSLSVIIALVSSLNWRKKRKILLCLKTSHFSFY